METTAPTIRRRGMLCLLMTPAMATMRTAQAAGGDAIYIGISGAYAGADSANSISTRNGAMMAIQDANDRGGIAGRKIETVALNEATATAGQYDPGQAAANARKFVADPRIVARVGPDHSGAGKAMAPILSQGDLATVTPDTTSPDITSPQFAGEFRPGGKPIDRHMVRDAIQVTNLDTIQGNIQFDENGDIVDRTISIFQVQRDPTHPDTDAIHQFKYIGSAPKA
jgi:ABC-type branched-subunit amino acid transport system substrate-binding protein